MPNGVIGTSQRARKPTVGTPRKLIVYAHEMNCPRLFFGRMSDR